MGRGVSKLWAWPWLAALAGAACNGDGAADSRGDSAGSGILTQSGTGTGTSAATSGEADSDDRLDVGNGTEGGSASGGDCPGSGGSDGDTEYSYIWIANSPEGTVSKIDTVTGVELARYMSGPTNGGDDPSRTSVNLIGDVAVANRSGGITKIAAREDRCEDANGDGVITTSTGPNDVLPFGEDECMLWYVALPTPDPANVQGPRPTAWDAGTQQGDCVVDDARVWNGWWVEAENTAYFRRFDGKTGATLDDVIVPDYSPQNEWGYGPYGGAVDADGNFWVTGLLGPLLRIDAVTLDVDVWPLPDDAAPYGMGVDADGDVWMVALEGGAITHFSPQSQLFDVYPTPNGSLRGMMIDRNGHLWAAGNDPCGLVQFDTAARVLVNAAVALPGCVIPVGVSIDVDGYVWAPDQGGNVAYKVDPITYATSTTPGLVGPYTYSDMTGAGLGLVVNPPQG
jgi:hypothetical protein